MMINDLSSGIKNAADIVKKADNFELYSMLLDLQAKALELQEENQDLRNQLNERSRVDVLRTKIIRHKQPFITMQDDEVGIYYCAHCWDCKEKLIQLNTYPRSAEFVCPECKNTGVYDVEVNNRYERARQGIGII